MYVGSWQHGFMSMTAVGATNVGSIKVYFDETLATNKTKWSKVAFEDRKFKLSSACKEMLQFKKGDAFGEFNLGSTIVLLFEAPKGSVLNVKCHQKIKMGEPLLSCKSYAEFATTEDELLHDKGVVR